MVLTGIVLVAGLLVMAVGWWEYETAVCTVACTSADPDCCAHIVATEKSNAWGLATAGIAMTLLGLATFAAIALLARRWSGRQRDAL